MERSYIKGLSFGLGSGLLTTLGVMIGLHSGTNSQLAVIGGVLTVALADAFSDAFGIHLSEKADNKRSETEIWKASLGTFLGKAFFGSTFLIPVLLLELTTAIYVSVLWSLFLLAGSSYWMAKDQKKSPFTMIGQYWFMALFVVAVTHYLGVWINFTFN